MLSKLKDERRAKWFLLKFYAVGVAGMLIPYSNHFFTLLIPFSLLLTAGYLFYFHQDRFRLSTIISFALIIIGGICIEILGVNTGLVFGNYHYGSSLGPKIFQTPLLIGINWLFMVYASASILERTHKTIWIRIVGASALMVGYDLVLEQAAPIMDMWYWAAGTVPLQNYFAWFACALVFHSVLAVARVKTSNPLALLIFGLQFIFLSSIALFLR